MLKAVAVTIHSPGLETGSSAARMHYTLHMTLQHMTLQHKQTHDVDKQGDAPRAHITPVNSWRL